MLRLTYLYCKNHVLLSVIQLPQGWPCLRTFELAVPFAWYVLYPSFGLSDSFFMTQLKCHLLREAFHECLSNIDHHLASVTLYHLVSLLRLSEQSLPVSAMTFLFVCDLAYRPFSSPIKLMEAPCEQGSFPSLFRLLHNDPDSV